MADSPRLERLAVAWLRFPRATKAALALAGLLSAPALGLGLYMDDYMQLLLVRGFQAPGSRWNLFCFASGDPSKLLPFIERGPYPWWTLPTVKLSFWRPLSSALVNLDAALFGDFLPAYHLHSIAWYLAAVFAVSLLLRRALPPALGAGALLLFAIAQTHVLPAAWLANRNSLVAFTPALLGLCAHLRWREQGWRPGLPLSLLGYLVALTGGESALGVFAYLAAYELLAAPGAPARRLAALAPAAVLGLGYVVAYRLTGSGAWGSAIYLDPISSPGAFLAAAPARFFALSAGQLAGVSADLWLMAPPLRPFEVAVGALSLAGVGLLLRRAWPGLDAAERRALRWLGAGALASMVPVLATFPTNRLLLVPSLGACAVLAVLLRHGYRSAARADRWAAVALALVHVPLNLLGWPAQEAAVTWVGRRVTAAILSAELDDAQLPRQRVLSVTYDPLMGLYPPMVRAVNGHPLPQAWWPLSIAPLDHRLTRTGERTFDLEPVDGHLLGSIFEQLFRADDQPLPVGQPIALAGLTVTVLEAKDGKPTRVGFEADRPLEDPSLVFLTWKDGGLRRFAMPAVGQTLLLRFELGPWGRWGG